MADQLSQVINKTEESISEVIDTDLVNAEPVKLDNLSVNDILEKCNNEEVLDKSIPYENVRNNNKIFLIYYAKSQLERVIKLTGYLEQLEDQLMANSWNIDDPNVIMRMIQTIQSSMTTAINLIDRVSTNDDYVKLIFNDNRQIINNLGQTTINASNNIHLSKESRTKVRELAENLLSQINSDIIDNGGNNGS